MSLKFYQSPYDFITGKESNYRINKKKSLPHITFEEIRKELAIKNSNSSEKREENGRKK